MSAISLRPATSADASRVSACVRSAYEHYIERLGKPPGPMLEDYTKVIQQHQVFIAESFSNVIGILVLGKIDGGFRLMNIAVEPSAQKQGIGKILLQFAESEARRLGHSTIYLSTNEKMIENQALYSKIGYVEYERRVENGYARVYMRKQLA